MYSDTELKAVKFRHLPEAINPGNTRKSFHNQVPDCFILQVLGVLRNWTNCIKIVIYCIDNKIFQIVPH